MSKKSQADADTGDKKLTEGVNFEAALGELEALVSQMESGELSLDESLKAFERGIGGRPVADRHCRFRMVGTSHCPKA